MTGLPHFFESMKAYLAEPGAKGLERLYAAHPGWEAPRERVALYGRFVRHHVVDGLEKLFPLVRQCVGEAVWEELVRSYFATGPARHHELNRLGEHFPDFLADRTRERGGLPAWVPALARFEWTDFAVYASEEQVPGTVERLSPNPTVTVLQHPWRLCAFVRGGARGEPLPGEELALLWRHPRTLGTFYMAADDAALLALKMAVEGLASADVAAATGVDEARIRAAVERGVSDGLILAP
ncbi:putative DNA-binding protein [Archangium gephyra]|nr:putative DNA-binding domain-containing protein [Archangium gephyra]REG28844.1 putative DNA-binding protein [Archangium gephyra]